MKSPELKVIYNPFTVKTTFFLNGSQENTCKLEESTRGSHIQHWIHKFFTPDLFRNIINGNEIDFVFEGAEVDADDVRDAVNEFNDRYENSYKINDKYITYPIQADKKIQELRDLFNEAQSGPFDAFRSSEIHKAFEKALSPEFDVTVLATMSAGKSTVINAIAGTELLPSKQQACTATIARVINDDSMSTFNVRRLGNDGVIIDDWQIVEETERLDLITKWNEDKDTSTIEIKGNIPAINTRDGIQMVLVDTPGPNNSRDASHRAATERAIQSSQPSMVLYILNATQSGVDDDKSLLSSIKEAMSKGGREAQDRFIFIANKIDEYDSDKETVSSAIHALKTYLENNGITNPIVIPASAELTKLIRIKRAYGEELLTNRQKRNLFMLTDQFVNEPDMNLLTRSRDDLSPSVYQKLKNKVDEARTNQDEERLAELLSGIPIIETLLDNYLLKHAVPARIKDAVQVFNTVAHENKIKQEIDKILNLSKSELDEAVTMLDNIQNSEARIKQADDFKKKINSLKYQESKVVKEQVSKVDKQINGLLDSLSDAFSQAMEPSDAANLMNKVTQETNTLFAEILVSNEQSLRNDIERKVTELSDDYSRYVNDLLGNFPKSGAMDAIKSLQSTSLKMPDVKSLIAKSTFEEEKRVFVRTERHGFLWLKKRDIYKSTYQDKVDMKKVGDDFTLEIQKNQFSLIDTFEQTAKDNFESAKKILLNHMKDLDEKLENTMNQIKIAQNDKKQKQSILDKHKVEHDWFNDFEAKLNKILEVGV